MSDFREVVFSPLRDVNNGEFSPSTDDTSPTYNSNHNYGDNRNCSGMNSYNHTDVNRPFDSNNGDRRDRESDNFNSNSNYHGDSPNILKFAGGNSSSFGATCNFVNSIVGAGMIGNCLL